MDNKFLLPAACNLEDRDLSHPMMRHTNHIDNLRLDDDWMAWDEMELTTRLLFSPLVVPTDYAVDDVSVKEKEN